MALASPGPPGDLEVVASHAKAATARFDKIFSLRERGLIPGGVGKVSDSPPRDVVDTVHIERDPRDDGPITRHSQNQYNAEGTIDEALEHATQRLAKGASP